MPELSRFLGITITMYFNDHNPPHFHAEYNGEEACFEIASLKRIDGALPPRICGYVVEWGAFASKRVAKQLAVAAKRRHI